MTDKKKPNTPLAASLKAYPLKRAKPKGKASATKGKASKAKPKEKNKGGRPTDYKPEYNEMAYKLCLLLDATDKDLADFFMVSEATINNWKRDYPEFLVSITRGKTQTDMEVAAKLVESAQGFSHEEEKLFCYEGIIVRAATRKQYPPDVKAQQFWLMNRQPAKWKNKQTVEVEGLGSLVATLQKGRERLNSFRGQAQATAEPKAPAQASPQSDLDKALTDE